MRSFHPRSWQEYELIDSGNGRKLERFGEWTLNRPEPIAIWPSIMNNQEWEVKTDAFFEQSGPSSGKWIRKEKSMPDSWDIHFKSGKLNLKFRLILTRFKHVGLFPEQALNWEYIYDRCSGMQNAKVLNLFAYTGGASLAARAAGADVIHCDSIKQVVTWANTNMQLSGLEDIRWLVEDALKFVKREARRGNLYNGLIMDPPAWGKGPGGENWKLEDQFYELLTSASQILDQEQRFMVLNVYSDNLSPFGLENFMHSVFGKSIAKKSEHGELCLRERSGRKMPTGNFIRFYES